MARVSAGGLLSTGSSAWKRSDSAESGRARWALAWHGLIAHARASPSDPGEPSAVGRGVAGADSRHL